MKERPMDLSEKQLDKLRHMLGLNDPSKREQVPFRDYAAVNPGAAEFLELEAMGMVRKYAERGSYWWYCTTDAGKAAAIKSALARRLPKSKRLYTTFLDIADAFPDLTFKQFLTSAEFAETRRGA